MAQQTVRANARTDNQPLANFTDPCRNCNHILGIYRLINLNISKICSYFKHILKFSEKHVTQLQGLPGAEINRLLAAVVDVENIFMSMHREDDQDTKRVYYFLFKVLTVCYVYIILSCSSTCFYSTCDSSN